MKQYFVKSMPKILAKKSSKYVYPYLEVWVMGKRSRVNINKCKVLATQWCKDKCRAYISPLLSNLDNRNNSIANEKIEAYIVRYKDFINYLCNQPNNVANFHKEFKAYMIMDKPSKPQPIDVFETIEHAIINNTKINERTRQNNYIGKGLKALRAFSDARHEAISNFDMITPDLIYEFADWISSGNYTNNGSPYAVGTLNSIIKYAVSAIKCTPTTYISKGKAQTLKAPQLTDKTSKDNEIALRDNEVIRLWNYKPTSKTDEEIRDMFLLLCLTGQRVSDLKKFQGGIDEVDGIPCLKLVQEKCSHKIKIDIIFPLAIDILNKYTKLPLCDIEKKINNNICRIANEAGIIGYEQIARHYQGNDKPVVKDIARTELIHTHTGRRSFVSILSVHGWSYERIGKYTGQIQKTVALYDKSTSIDKRIYETSQPDERLEVVGETYQPQPIIPQQLKNRGIEDISEGLRVLRFLGVEVSDNITFDEIVNKVKEREAELMDFFGVDARLLKTLFNQEKPMIQRMKALNAILKIWVNKD